MQTQPINPADLDAATHAFEEARQRMEALRDDYRRYRAKRETTEKSMRAAHAAAETADAQWRARLRDDDGAITPEIKQLRKEAQAAADLADEYKSIHDEITRGLETRKLALAEAASECMRAHRTARDAAVTADIIKIASSLESTLQPTRALFHAGVISNRLSPEWTDDPKEIDQRFVFRLLQAMGPLDSSLVDTVCPSIDFSDVDMELARSPVKRRAFLEHLPSQQRACTERP